MITYATTNEARAAAKEQGLAPKSFEVVGDRTDGVSTYHIRMKAEQPAKAVIAKVTKAAKADKAKPAPVEEMGVCARVQAFANANPTMARKDVIAAMVTAGVHKATASIQTAKADAKAGRVRA
ncbi:MAG: hypothetical protein E5Y02_10440 [Mesorhizobium sp.]|nr:MAG: hypothetical protein E5Y02_10440 [Mesorhizobium sp.]